MRRGKWLKTLRTIVDRMDKRNAPRQAVKTILRPPTTYKYVIGMSGGPSTVPVYPRSMWNRSAVLLSYHPQLWNLVGNHHRPHHLHSSSRTLLSTPFFIIAVNTIIFFTFFNILSAAIRRYLLSLKISWRNQYRRFCSVRQQSWSDEQLFIEALSL